MKFLAALFKFVLLMLTLVYILFLVKTLFLERYYMRTLLQGYQYNLMPFKTITDYIQNYEHYNFNTWFNNLFGNILLFVPFGFIVPYFAKRFRGWASFVIVSISLITLIEILQMLLHFGSFDVDDVILNSLGAIIGFLIFQVSHMFVRRIFKSHYTVSH